MRRLSYSHLASMAEVEDCFSCSTETKYTCLNCKTFVCMRCCYFEEDEETFGWKEGYCVGRCDDCFREKVRAFNSKSSSLQHSPEPCSRSSVQDEESTRAKNNPLGRCVF